MRKTKFLKPPFNLQKKSRDFGAGKGLNDMKSIGIFVRKNKHLWPLVAVTTFIAVDFILLALRAGGVL